MFYFWMFVLLEINKVELWEDALQIILRWNGQNTHFAKSMAGIINGEGVLSPGKVKFNNGLFDLSSNMKTLKTLP